MKSKVLIGLLFLALFTGQASAAITSVDIQNVFPDANNIETGFTIVGRIESDSTTSTTVNTYIVKPNGTTTQVGSTSISVKSGSPRTIDTSVDASEVKQYGTYTLKLNETNNGMNETSPLEIAPDPSVNMDLPTTVYSNELREDIQVNVKTDTSDILTFSYLVPGNITLYNIDDDPSTPSIEKTMVSEKPLVKDPSTRDLEVAVNATSLNDGDYEVIADFNISSCSSCEDYEIVSSDTFSIKQDYARTTFQDKWGSQTANSLVSLHQTTQQRIQEVEDDVATAENNIMDAVNSITGIGSVIEGGKNIFTEGFQGKTPEIYYLILFIVIILAIIIAALLS